MAELITKRDYKEWLEFCKRVQNSTGIRFNEEQSEQNARKKRALKDYNFYVKTYFPIYADYDCAPFHIKAANKILKDPNILAVLKWPREHAKSVHANIFIPMWLLAHGELTGMILMGKNSDDASNLLADVQAQLQYNELFAHDFGEQYSFGNWEEGDFTTKSGVRFLALGRGQSPRGARKNEKRPNYASIDDVDDDEIVHNPKRVDKVVKNIMGALYFALSIKGARMVVSGNGIHQNSILNNIIGGTLSGGKKRKGVWVSEIVAINNMVMDTMGNIISGVPAWARYTLKELVAKIEKAGPVLGMQEFFHKTEIDGKNFKNEYFRWVRLPRLQKMKVLIGYFDPSFVNSPTSDYKAIPIWGLYNNKKYCYKRFCRRCELTQAFRWMVHVEKGLPAGVGIIWYMEKQFISASITSAKRVVEKETGHKLNIIIDNRTKPNKYSRMITMVPDYANGNTFYNVLEKDDPDMVEGNLQLKGIEPGYKTPDDSPDADEGAWYYLDMHIVQQDFKVEIGKDDINELRRW